MSKSTVLAAICSSIILGGSLVYSAMINRGLVMKASGNQPRGEIITTVSGHVNLGTVYFEKKMIDVTVTVKNKDGDKDEIISLKGLNPFDYESALQDKLQEIADSTNKTLGYADDDKKKLLFDTLSLKNNGQLKITTYVHYRSEYQPDFTLTIYDKGFVVPENVSIFNSLSSSIASVVSESKAPFEDSMYLIDNHKGK